MSHSSRWGSAHQLRVAATAIRPPRARSPIAAWLQGPLKIEVARLQHPANRGHHLPRVRASSGPAAYAGWRALAATSVSDSVGHTGETGLPPRLVRLLRGRVVIMKP